MKPLRHPRRLYRVVLSTAAAAVITLAVLVSAARLLVPQLEDYRAVVQVWASELLGQPVTVGGMDAKLFGLSPSIELTEIALVSPVTARPILRADALAIDLDVAASLRQRRPVLDRLIITGADLALERNADGALRITGLAARENGAGADAFSGWLLSQPRVVLRRSRLEWREPDRPVRRFDDIEIELENDGDRHRLNAAVALPAEMGERIKLALDLEGEMGDPETWVAALFVGLEGVRPAPWFEGLDTSGVGVDSGRIDASVWSEWREGALQSFEGEIEGRDLVLTGEAGRFGWERLASRFHWDRAEEGWRLSLADLVAARGGRQWPGARIELTRKGDGFEAAADFLRMEDAAAVLALAPQLESGQRQLLADLEPRGDLRDVLVSGGGENLKAQARFSDLGVNPAGRVPGFRGFDGELSFDQQVAEVHLTTRQAEVRVPRLFREALPLERLDGRVRVRRGGRGWEAQAQELVFGSSDLAGRAEVAIAVPVDGGAPFVDLRGDFRDGRAPMVPRYLPARIMPPAAVKWLDHAFRDGRVAEGTVLLHGRTSDFPFQDGSGRFEVRFRAEQVELAYRDGWPRLTGVSGDVTFDGARMDITAHDGRYLGTRIDGGRVVIEDLTRARLQVDAAGRGPAGDVLRTLRETPLADRIGREGLEGLAASGETALKLQLQVPLSDRRQEPLKVGGELTLAGNRLTIAPQLAIEQLHGTLRFEDTDFSSGPLAGRLLGAPVRLTVATTNRTTTIAARGHATAQALAESFGDIGLLQRLSGKTGWEASLHLPHGTGDAAELEVSSRLKGMAVRLPEPFTKVSGDALTFSLKRLLSGPHRGRLELAYGAQFRAVLALARSGALERASIHFGSRIPDLPDSRRIRLTGSVANLDPAEWEKLFDGTRSGSGRLPIEVAMYRLHIDSRGLEGEKSRPAKQTPWPALDLRVQRLEVDELLIGRVRLRALPGRRQVSLPEIEITAPSFAVAGSGMWLYARGVGNTTLDLELKAPHIGRMMADLGFVNVITRGRMSAEGQLTWPGSPTDFSVRELGGSMHARISDGHIDDVEPGGGRLLGLFSLSALHKRLRLDFSDLFRKGLPFDSIEGDLTFEKGDVVTDNLALDSNSAKVVMSGRTGLVSQDYDMIATVVPNVSDSLALAGGLALGPQAGAILWVLQKLFRNEIDKATMFQYSVSGPWSAPAVERLPRPGSDDR